MIHSPPPPSENTTDLHVHKHDEAVGICLVSGEVPGSQVGAWIWWRGGREGGREIGRETQCWAGSL